ncbi:glycosyltransferase [Mongoliitalea daihaiensis]|uniref:glycosyltransferase n=1 Tax=Mongoliitalea daihaiensis TaxID=2782006 RepID=UPI001F48FD42|nr:glycosyltransferase [Mongoliitalea daihaiensis]UJP64102.1 glycosyltransferase [Mongoliitalea daihaiensis]
MLSILSKQPPRVLIITTWELLPAACIGKLIWKWSLIYDVQENYSMNVQWNQPFLSSFRKNLQRSIIQFVEGIFKRWIDHFILAENCYKTELPSFQPFDVIENTFSGNEKLQKNIRISAEKPIRFLITGTLTPVYGVIEGIYWFQSLAKHYSNVQLIILGHCPMEKFEQKLIDLFYDDTRIVLTVSQNPIPYKQILEAYAQADIVLLPYHQIPSIAPKIPSKLFECLALKKPMLYQQNPAWEKMIQPHLAGFGIDFQQQTNYSGIIEKILSTEFYTIERIPEILWKNQEKQFLNLIQKLS